MRAGVLAVSPRHRPLEAAQTKPLEELAGAHLSGELEFLIWSFEHGAWWCLGERGYTRQLDQAGRYPLGRAIEIAYLANAHDRRGPQEAIVPIPKGRNWLPW